MSTFAVTLNYNCHYGYVTYDTENKKAEVVLDPAEAREAVERFLAEPLTLDLPRGDTIRDFATVTLAPLASLDNFRVCLTRLWGKTGVRVEWSMPPGMAGEL